MSYRIVMLGGLTLSSALFLSVCSKSEPASTPAATAAAPPAAAASAPAPVAAPASQPVASADGGAQNVQIALDGAADLSPVYATAKIPANARQLVAVFTYGDQQQHKITTQITPIAATGKYTINSQGQAEAIASGDGTRFLVRHVFLSDLPVGRWHLAVTVDDKLFGSQEFEVVPAAAPLKLTSSVELMGSLTKGTEWTCEVRALHEPRRGLQIPFDGITEADPLPGWLRGTTVTRVIAFDPEGVRTDIYRGGKLASSAWTLATDKGIAVSKMMSGGAAQEADPPELIIDWPGVEFQQSWRWHDNRQKPEFGHQFEMWGPLPVKTPNGEGQGYVMLQKIPDGNDPTVIASSTETHIMPGLGIVYTASVQSIPQYQTAIRIETRLTSMKRGSGPEPEMRKYAGSPDK
jgi:hypothetical protein